MYSQDISVKSITVNDNAAVCSNAPLDSDIIIEFETNQAFDFRGKTFSVLTTGANPIASQSFTISGTADKFNLPSSGTVTLSLYSSLDLVAPTTDNFFLNNGNTSIQIEFLESDSNGINNTLTKQYTVNKLSALALFSTPSGFSFCSDDTITLYTTNLGGDTKYYWSFSQTSSVVIEGSYFITKNAGELVNGEKVQLYVVSGSCTSTVVSQTLTINDQISDLVITPTNGITTICDGDSTLLTASGTGVDADATISWKIGSLDYQVTNTTTFTLTSIDFGSSQTVTVTVSVTPNGSSCASEKAVQITKIKLNSGSIAPSTSTVCYGDIPNPITSNTAVTTSTLGTDVSYRWEGTTNTEGDFTAAGKFLINQNSTALTFTDPLLQTTWFRRIAIGTLNGVSCEVPSAPVKVNVSAVASPTITSDSGGFTFCTVDTATFRTTELGGDTKYYWSFSQSAPVWTEGTFFIEKNGSSLTNGEKVQLYVVSGSCTSTVVSQTLTINDQISDLVITPTNGITTICDGDSTILTASGTGVDADATIQWTVDQTTFNSYSTTYTLNSEDFSSSVTVTVRVTPQGSTCFTEKSIQISKVKLTAGTITTTNAVFCSTDTPNQITSQTNATKTSLGTVLSYRWESTTTAGGNFNTPSTVSIANNNTSLTFNSPITETTWYRRIAIGTLNGVSCEVASPAIKIEIERIQGGSFSPASLDTCSLVTNELILEPTENSSASGGFTYQWQKSITTTASESFSNIDQANASSYEVTLSTSQTTYFRRIIYSNQLSDTTCGIAYSDVFSYYVNDLEPGTLTDYGTGYYCYGSVPNRLGENSEISGSVIYQWQYTYAANPVEGDWVSISGAQNQTYSPPPLYRDISYRRGVKRNDGSNSNCWTYTEPVTFSVLELLNVGYIEESVPVNSSYCYGEPHPSLSLGGISQELRDDINSLNQNNPLMTWEVSSDKITWQTVAEQNDDRVRTTLNRNYGLSDEILLTTTLYYRAKFEYKDNGSGNGYSVDFDNDPLTAVTTQTTTAETIAFFHNGVDETLLNEGEVYAVLVGSFSVSVTTATNSTTDQVGTALASELNAISGSTNLSAVYYSAENIMVLNNLGNKNISVDSTRGTAGMATSIDLYYLSQTNAEQNCIVYSEVFTLEVEPTPSLNLASGVPETQIVCNGDSLFTPITVEYSGPSANFSYTPLPSGLVISSQTSNSITITGTPTTDGQIAFSLTSECYGGDQNFTYSYRVVENPPSIFEIFKDFDDPGYAIFTNGAGDTTGYNNSVCVNTDQSAVNSTKFYACFTEDAYEFSTLEWEFIDTSGTNTNSPTVLTNKLYAPNGAPTRLDGEEIGIEVTWNKSFVTSISGSGQWVTVRVRSISSCNSLIKSPWKEKDVWLVGFSDTGTNSQTLAILPALEVPTAFNPGLQCELANYSRIDIPTCEQVPIFGNQPYTQFFTQATSGTNDYSYLEWDIISNPSNGSTSAEAGTIDGIGRLMWNSGFFGTFRVKVRPVSCSSSGTLQTSEDDWVESALYTIGELEKVVPTLTATGLPLCPISESGTQTSTLNSDINVHWFIKDLSLIETNSVTQTGETFLNYIGVEGDASDPFKQLTFAWKNNAEGSVLIKAVPTGCASQTGTDDWARNFSIEAPKGPELRKAPESLGTTPQEICENDTNFTPILYDVIGKSVLGVEITDNISPTSNLAERFNTNFIQLSQTVTVTWVEGNTPYDRLYNYVITINDTDFKYVGTSVGQTYDSVMTNLRAIIDSDPNYSATIDSGTNKLVIEGKAGVAIKVVNNTTNNAKLNLSMDVSAFKNQFEISGLNTPLPLGNHQFKVKLIVAEGCTEETDVSLDINVNANVDILLDGSSENSPIVCYNQNFEPIEYTVSGLDNNKRAYVEGLLPLNATYQFINQGSAQTSVLSITSSGNTNYWNTRTFDYQIRTEGDSCDDGFNPGGTITVYPKDYLRPNGHYDGGPNDDINVQQTLCEGTAITPVTYEFWGATGIDVEPTFGTIAGLSSTISSRQQIASIGFDSNSGKTETDSQQYSVFINDVEFRVIPSKSNTSTDVLNLLNTKINNESAVVSSQVSGSVLLLTAAGSGTTFSLSGLAANAPIFRFGEPKMIQAPKIITITGTPTILGVDNSFQTANVTQTTYQFSLKATSSNCNSNSETATYTLHINPKPRLQIFQGDNEYLCDGGNSDHIIGINYKAANKLEISVTTDSGSTTLFDPVFLDNFNSSYSFPISRNAFVTETTTYTFTITATAAYSCSSTPTTSVVSGTYYVIPHYLNFVSPSNLMSQTLCIGSDIKPVIFNYSAGYSTPSIIWGSKGYPGVFSLTTSGTSLTLSGTLGSSSTITQTTSYPFTIRLEGSEDANSNCNTYEETGSITVVVGPKLSLSSPSSTTDQTVCSGEAPSTVTYAISGAASEVNLPTWKANGKSIPQPSWMAYNSDVSGEFSLLSSGNTGPVDVITVYEYELTTAVTKVGGFICQEDTQKGYITVYPDATFTSEDFIATGSVCEGDYFSKNIYFKNAKTATASYSSDLGLSKTISYTTKQSFTFVVSGTASAGQTNILQILNDDQSGTFVEESFTYEAVQSSETSSTIAQGLKTKIESKFPSQFTVSIVPNEAKITLTASANANMFGVRFLTSDQVEMEVVSSTSVEGFISLTATITTDLVTQTTTYPFEFKVENASCSSATLEYNLEVKPFEEIQTSGGTLSQTLCYNEAISPINITGGTAYEVSWSPGPPTGIVPVNGEVSSSTLTLSGTHKNLESTTTSYTYTLSLVAGDGKCISSNQITGTLWFLPEEKIVLTPDSGAVTQTLCSGGELTPIKFDLSNGFTNEPDISWTTTPKPEGISAVYSATAKTFIISGNLPSSVTTETVYTFTVTFTGNSNCAVETRTGSITLQPAPSITLTSSDTTLDQVICFGEAIQEIEARLSVGVSEVSILGLPTGLTYLISGQTLTISGTIQEKYTVPKTFSYKIKTENELCEQAILEGYIVTLPIPEITIVDAPASSNSVEVDICNGDEIGGIQLRYKNMSSLVVINPSLPSGTDSLTFSNNILQRQETEITVNGSATNVGEQYILYVKPLTKQQKSFSYTTTQTLRTSAQIAQGLLDAIKNNASTTVSASIDGSKLTLYNTSSSTLFFVKSKSIGTASITVNTTKEIIGNYIVSGTVSVSADTTSFTLELGDENSNLCAPEDNVFIKFNIKEPAYIQTTGSTSQTLHPACDGENVVLNFEYGGDNVRLTGNTNVTWTPQNPGLDLKLITGTNSFTLSGVLSSNVTQTTNFEYTITTEGASCSDFSFTGSIRVTPKQMITHVANTNFEGGSDEPQGYESQVICDGNPLNNPIKYEFRGGTTSHTLSWSPSLPGGIQYIPGVADNGGYSFTISGTVTTNITTQTTYQYTITTVGNNCNQVERTGSITVIPKPFMSLATPGTNYQIGPDAVCNLSSSSTITYQLSGSSIDATILWTGVNGTPQGLVKTIDPITNELHLVLNANSTASNTIKYEYAITSVSQLGCGPTTTLYGAIEVLPTITILEDYIRQNDISHVSCNGGSDGSINIPVTPNSEFDLRIYGGQNAIAQVDVVTLLSSATLQEDDIVRVKIDNVIYSGIVPSNPATSTILQSLANAIEVSNTKVTTSLTTNSLVLTAATPGVPFTAEGVVISSSTTTGTTLVSTTTSNVTLDFQYTWTNENLVVVGNEASLVNQPAGTYVLTVSINGCATSSATFEIEEPSMTHGNVGISCDGDLSIPLSITMTRSQLKSNDFFTATLYELQGNLYTAVATKTITPNTTLSSYTLSFPFYPLERGLTYRIFISDQLCASNVLEISNIGPISERITINENLITTTAIQCWGENDGTISVSNNAVNGGSGNYTYQWTSSSGIKYDFKNLINIPPGLYSLTVSDNENDCSETVTGIEVEDKTPVAQVTNASSDLINQCIDGTNGLIQIGVSNGFAVKWEFTPSTTSQTFELTNAADIFQFKAADKIPNGYSTTGVYTYYLYEGGLGTSCAVDGGSIRITGPSPVSLSSSLTFENVKCAGQEDGAIQFTATGGIPPYSFSLRGGVPSNAFSNGNINYITGLGPGTYNIVIGDSTPSDCTPNTFTTTVTISEPEGGPLELSEGEIKPISCGGDLGSFEVLVSGGAAKVLNGTAVETNYQVFVDGPGDSFALNTAHKRGESSFVIDNLTTPGDYMVTVTDGSGFCKESITITVETIVEGLSATAIIEGESNCASSEVSTTGYSIKITNFEKGDGEIAGYPLWQKQSSKKLDSFTLTLNGTVSGTNLSQIGINLSATTSLSIFATATESQTINGIQDVASILAFNINKIPYLTATLNGSSITVKGEIIDSVTPINTTSPTLIVSVSAISKITESIWVNVPETAGKEVIENLQAGFYRGIIQDGSGCGGVLIENATQGGFVFKIDSPQSLQFKDIEFEEITCITPTSSLEFKLSNGVYTLVPNPSQYELTLNSVLLKSTLGNDVTYTTGTSTNSTQNSNSSTSSTGSDTSSSSVVGNNYTPNLTRNTFTINNILPGDYFLTVENKQSGCVVSLDFSIENAPALSYSGETEFVIDPCYDTYQEPFFDPLLIEGGTKYINLAGEEYYSLVWKFYPVDPAQSVKTINTLSTSVNFKPNPGTYKLFIYDANGCSLQDENGGEAPLEFTFKKELTDLIVKGTAGANGDQFSIPVSCEIDAEDGEIHIAVESLDPNTTVLPPFDIFWDLQLPNDQGFEQRILFEGVAAGDSLEVYSIRLNDIPFTYNTVINDEPKKSVVNELTQIIDQSVEFEAKINENNSNEIIVKTISRAVLDLEIISRNTKLQMIQSTPNNAQWIPLDGTNGFPNYKGFLDLTDLAEGLYRYTIRTVEDTECENNVEPDQIQGVITVENENILEIREGPVVDEYLCNGQPGTLFVDIFDGDTGPLTFFYNDKPVTYEQVGTNQYIINIDDPVEFASLEIYNANNCGVSRKIRIGNGIPLFDFSSVNFEQSGVFLAREEVTFTDLSENEYDSFEFNFGDGNQTDVFDRNYPEPITHEYAISGTYYVTLSIYNELGCKDELTKTIKIGKGYNILVPNVFTPNGDIWNATFRPTFNGLSEITLRIYDHQGSLLFEEEGEIDKDPKIEGVSLLGWDGANEMNSSPYFIYTISAKTIDEQPVFRDGTFIILR